VTLTVRIAIQHHVQYEYEIFSDIWGDFSNLFSSEDFFLIVRFLIANKNASPLFHVVTSRSTCIHFQNLSHENRHKFKELMNYETAAEEL
jgi:hypothetical protein